MKIQAVYLFLFLQIFPPEISGQGTFNLENPSFELGKPECGKLPKSWKTAGNKSQLPGIQPNCGKLQFAAKHGKRYLSLLTKSSGTRQGIRQTLGGGGRLEKGKQYGFSLFMAKTKALWEVDAIGDPKIYDHPAALQIWGTNKTGTKRELLAESALAKNQDWRKFNFVMEPKDGDWTAIELVAMFENPGEHFNGHLFLDDLQPIMVLKNEEARRVFDDPDSVRPFSKMKIGEAENPKPKFFEWKKAEKPASGSGNRSAGSGQSRRSSTVDKSKKIEAEIEYHEKNEASSQAAFDTNWVKVNPINLFNPSFEDKPRCCSEPIGWISCSEDKESPPDIQPGFFSVTMEPFNGESYLGLVVRDNDTQETIAQHLSKPLERGRVYSFSMAIARSVLYLSMSRVNGEEANFAMPAVLEIYGGNSVCERVELLASTSHIANTTWKEYQFMFTPKRRDYEYLIFKAAYNPKSTLAPYNGNLLLDNCSPIYEMIKKN